MSVEKVREYFRQHGLADRIMEFGRSSATVELAAAVLGCEPGRIAKTLSFALKTRVLLIVAAGDARIDNAKYKARFGAKAKMLLREETEAFTGHPAGGVCPFAVNPGVEIYLDRSLQKYDCVFPACGSADSAIGLSIAELERYSGGVWVDVCKKRGKLKMQSYREIKTDLQHLKAGAGTIVEKNEKPGRGAAVAGYFNSGAVSLRFIFGEKENIVFAFLQWAVIGIAYYLWVQALALVPEDVWQSGDGGDSAVSLVLLMWSFVCVGLAAYPLGLLTACMNASYILRFTGRESTVAECLKIVLPKSWSLWVFSWLDGWWTVMRILERLPKKNDRTPLAVKLANEAVYQGWKLSSLGFLPALLSGRSVGEACGDSLNLLKERFGMLVKLRIGYSLVCWGFGIVGYLGMFALLWMLPELSGSIFEDNAVYEFYLLAGAPLLAVLIFIMLVFRPVYVISACRIYAFYAREKGVNIKLPESSSRGISALTAFLLLAAVLAAAWFFRDRLGIAELMNQKF